MLLLELGGKRKERGQEKELTINKKKYHFFLNLPIGVNYKNNILKDVKKSVSLSVVSDTANLLGFFSSL